MSVSTKNGWNEWGKEYEIYIYCESKFTLRHGRHDLGSHRAGIDEEKSRL